jgi:hypothetical protein
VKRLLALGLIALGLTLLPASPSSAACIREANLVLGTATCFNNSADLRHYVASAEGSLYAYRVTPQCVDEAEAVLCSNPVVCGTGTDTGTLYATFRRPLDQPTAPWERFGTVCLVAGESRDFNAITWDRVFQVMKTLEWPEAVLEIQPVGGRTLVNFETNVYTTLKTEPRIKTVRLAGRLVQIEATPVEFTWHWGDGSDPSESEGPGAPHVDGVPHEAFHEYTDAGVTVRPSVDVTYRGRYKVEDDPWESVHETLTVEGTPVPLEVITARVHLVG